jgi:hypothetical protein
MSDRFAAHSLVQTKTSEDRRTFELTFVNARGDKHTLSLPVDIAADLAPVLGLLARSVGGANGAKFTKIPKQWAVGTARHERLVLLKFDDDPPYALDPEVAETLWREVREETEAVSLRKEPALQ